MRNSAFTRPPAETTDPAGSSSNDASPLSTNKESFLKSDRELFHKQGKHSSSVRLSITEISRLAKAYSQEIGCTIHVSGNVIPITAEHKMAWRAEQEKFYADLISGPDAGLQMLHRYIKDFHRDKTLLESFPHMPFMAQEAFDPAVSGPNMEMKDKLAEIIDANKNGIRDKLLACAEKERKSFSKLLPEQIGYGARKVTEELMAIANNTEGSAHGYIFLFPVAIKLNSLPGQDIHAIPRRGHMEGYAVSSSGKIINVVPFSDDNGIRPDIEGQYSADVTSFLLKGKKTVLPQAGDAECGTMSLSYLKQYLKDNAKQFNENTLLLDGEILGKPIHFHLPSPQVLKYSQSNLYAKIVRAIVAGDQDTATIEHNGEKFVVKTLQGWLNAGATVSRPDGKEIPGGIEEFRKTWLELCDISDVKRLQMRVDDRNLYAIYASQRLKNKTTNALE